MTAPVVGPGVELVHRYPGNPILTGADFPDGSGIVRVFNSGIVKWRGRYLMACRAENRALFNSIWIAESTDGYRFIPRSAAVVLPYEDPEFAEYAAGMIYDPRVTPIDDRCYLVHAAHSTHSCRLSLLETVDFECFTWRGFISEVDNRNGVLFPRKIGGRYARLDRPNTVGDGGDIWLSYSPDLIHWGGSRVVLRSSRVRWAWTKIGPGAVPIETEAGWLVIFHGVRSQCKSHYVYQLGVCLLDKDEPWRVIAQAEEAILEPTTPYELVGQTPSVVFTCGAVVEDNGEIKLYYGGADTVQCLATTTVSTLLWACRNR